MPRLLLFVPSEKAILSAEENTVSLISVLEEINVSKPPDSNTVVPLRWSVVALWQQLANEEGKTYEQRTSLVFPDGKETAEAILRLEFDKQKYRTTVNINAFPVGQEGTYTLKIWLREVGDDPWKEITNYPIIVTYLDGKP